MKKQKISLKEISVHSFATSLAQAKVVGGLLSVRIVCQPGTVATVVIGCCSEP